MESKIISQEKNPFMQREEIKLEIKSESAPSFEEVKKAVGKDENLIVVKRVNSNFGTSVFTADVVVYDSVEAKKSVEMVPQKVRKKLAEEAKQKADAEAKAKAEEAKKAEAEKAAAPVEEATPEAPTEETKIAEAPAEAKTE